MRLLHAVFLSCSVALLACGGKQRATAAGTGTGGAGGMTTVTTSSSQATGGAPPAIDYRTGLALASISDMTNTGGPGNPLRFNGANKIVRVGGEYFFLSPTENHANASQPDYSQRIYRRAVSDVAGDWSLAATIADPSSTLPCDFGPGETITTPCSIRQVFTFTGSMHVDPAGYLHVFEFVAVLISPTGNPPPATTRLAHFVSTAPVTATGPLQLQAHVQPPTVMDTYPAGVVVAAHDDQRNVFHVLYWGAGHAYTPPNHDADFVAESGNKMASDPYRTGATYPQTALMVATLPDGGAWLQGARVLIDSEPVFYDAVADLGQGADFVACSGSRVAMFRSHKYPFAIVRGDELLVASVVNTEDCLSLTTGKPCTHMSPCVDFPVPGRLSNPHVNWTVDRYAIVASGGGYDLTKKDEVAVRPTTHPRPGGGTQVGEALSCYQAIDLFDVAQDPSGNVFFAGYESSEAIGSTCVQTRNRSISVLTAQNQFLPLDLVVDWTAQNGLPCLAQSTHGTFWFLTGGMDASMIGRYAALSFDGKHVTQTTLGSSVIAQPSFFDNTYFPQCLNDRSQRQSSDQLMFLASVQQMGDPTGVHRTLAIDGVDASKIVPTMIGAVDGVTTMGGVTSLGGWACGKFQSSPATVDVYVGGPKGTGTLVTTQVTQSPTEAQVSFLCQDSGVPHRFAVVLDSAFLQANHGKPLFVYGTGQGGSPTGLIQGSGTVMVP